MRLTAALFVLAVACFTIGAPLTFEWVDEGQIAYASWRVAAGEVPYRDFQHFYWPSLFLLNGGLLRLFGTDLLVLRLSVVAVKAAIVVLVFRLSCRTARWPFALGVALLCVAIFSAPYWLFTTPYATYHTTACTFAGMLVLLGGPTRIVRCALAGLLFGLGITFRQTTGVFAVAAALAFLALTPATAEHPSARGGRRLVALLLTGAAVVPIAYVLRPPITGTGLTLAAPWILSLLGVAVVRRRAAALPAASAGPVLALLAGAAVPPLLWVVWYAAIGALDRLVHDTLTTFPRAIRWFAPLELPPLSLVCDAGAIAGLLAGLAARDVRWRRVGWVLAAAFAAARAALGLWSRYSWSGDLVHFVLWLPLAATALSLALLGRARWQPSSAGDRSLALAHWQAAAALVALYPGADLPHAALLLPVGLPALARIADRVQAHAGARRGRAVGAVLALCLLACGAAPVVALARAAVARPAGGAGLHRATGIWQGDPRLGDTARVVAALDTLSPPGAPVLFLPTEQITYVLADRPSALQGEEMIFYLVALGLITPTDATTLANQQEMITRLGTSRPVVVRWLEGPGLGRFRAMFPALSEWIDAHYRPGTTIGRYEILTPNGTR